MDNLLGIAWRDWHKLLKDNNYAVDFPFWNRVVALSMKSRFNSRLLKKERVKWGSEIENTKIEKDPIFVLGHWRSGTTLLHNYLALDSQFAYPNLFQISNPHTFLFLEDKVKEQLEKIKSKKRPMDNVQINFDSPGEDAFAISMMSLVSPLLGWNFPRRADYYDKYLTLDDVSAGEIDRWGEAFQYFLKKLTLKYKKQLVLKSPSHTAIIKNILKLFPDARFIHIHRNPYKVFFSTLKLYKTAIQESHFQRPEKNLTDRIIKQYDLLYSAYLRDVELVSKDRIFELSYSDLSNNPMNTLEDIYKQLDISGFESAQPAFEVKKNADKNYKKNAFNGLSPDIGEKIQLGWGTYFDKWGYSHEMVE